MLSDYNSLKKLMMKKKLNFKQTRWTQILIIYDFEIFHRLNDKNSANELSKQFNYEKTSLLNIKLLSMLQNKLMLSLNEKSLTQNKRKSSIELIFIL